MIAAGARTHRLHPFDLGAHAEYAEWRARKLARYPRSVDELIVEIRDPDRLSPAEHEALQSRCAHANMAVYVTPPRRPARIDAAKEIARAIGAQLGLTSLDSNYLADDDGISALACIEGSVRGEFIPYTNRAIRWHTDGYYNPPQRAVRAMVLHCVQCAEQGGENRLLDHELVYLLLRDRDPGHIRTLMAADAMTIPARCEDGLQARAGQTGPVFSVCNDGGLHMRYTARTRSIQWKDDAATRAAIRALEAVLADSPYVMRLRLEPGMGLVCNNVLHDRAAFTDSPRQRRLLLRARYHELVGSAAAAGTKAADRSSIITATQADRETEPWHTS